jgi:hypothetical protein
MRDFMHSGSEPSIIACMIIVHDNAACTYVGMRPPAQCLIDFSQFFVSLLTQVEHIQGMKVLQTFIFYVDHTGKTVCLAEALHTTRDYYGYRHIVEFIDRPGSHGAVHGITETAACVLHD